MNRTRTMRRTLLATSALVAALGIPPLQADETVTGGATLNLGGATVFHNNLILDEGFLVNGTFDGSVLFDVRRGQIDAVLAGTGALVKTGTGTVVLTGANTYTGGTTINAGRIILSGAGEIVGNVNIVNNSPNDFFEFSKSSNYTYGGVISGYNVALTGTGTTTWTGENTHAYTGITAGTLTFSGAGTLGAANTWVIMSGGTMDLNGTTQSAGIFTLYDGGTALVTNGNLNVSNVFYADSGTMSANLGGTATVAKFSGGASILSGTNTYTGQTLINGGTLIAQGGSAITDTSAVTIASGATLQIDSNETIGSLAGAGNVALTTNTLTTGGTNGTTSFGGVLSGTGGLTKVGIGNFTLTGANTYTGLTTVIGGRMKLGTGGAMAGDIHVVDNGQAWFDFEQSGSYTYSGVLSGGQISQSGSGTTTLTGINSNNYVGIGQGTLAVSGSGTIGASNVTVGISGFAGTGTLDLGGTTQSISLLTMFQGWSNAVVNGTLNASDFLHADEGLISANLSGTATLIKNGAATTTLSGTNTYTGPTTINGGTLVLQGGAAIGDSNPVVIAAGATLQLDGDETIGSLAGGGNLALTTKTLIAGANNEDSLWSGTIFGGATSGLQKTGSGTLFVTGGMNQESTTVTAGTLNFNGTALGSIAINAGGRLSGTNTINGNLFNLGTLASGNSPGSTTVLGNYTGGGALDVEVQFDNAGTPVNGTTHDYLDIAGNVLGAPTAVNLLTFAPSGTPAATAGNGIQLVRVGGSTSAADFTMSSYLLGSYYYNLTYIANYSGTNDGFFLQSSLAVPGCSVTTGNDACFIDATTNQATPIDALAGSDTLQLTGATNFNFNVATIGTTYTNFETYQKAGTSTVTLTGTTGLSTLGFDVQNGTLNAGTGQLGATGANNILTPGILNVTSNVTTGSIAGNGSLVLGATLTTGGNNLSTTFAGTSSGTGGLTKSGSGVFQLTGANAFSGPLTVAAGNLSIVSGGSLSGPSSFTVQGGAQAFLGGTVQGVNGGGMTGTGIGAMAVNSGGTAYLDDNTTLSVASATLASGSNLNLFLTTNTAQYGKINASGTASVAGANVGVYLDPITFSGTPATTFTYSNVVTGSTVGGTFGSVNLLQAPSALFSVTGIYSPTSAGVQVTRASFSTLGGDGHNHGHTGDGLEDIYTTGTSDPDLINLFTVVGSAPAGSIPAIYAAIAGSEISENAGAGLRTDDPWKQSVAERVNAARTTGCTVSGDSWCLRRYAQATTNGGEIMSDVQGDPTAFDWLETGIRDEGTTSFWGRAIGAWGETTGDVEGSGSKQWTGGMIGGVDRVFNSLVLAGVALQYVETSVDYDASANTGLIKSGQVGAYVSYGGAEAYVNGNVSIIGTQASANRYMSIGLLNYDVSSFARSWALTASVEGGTIMEFDGFRFEPSIALNYAGAQPIDFAERGGGGLSLIVHPDDSNSVKSTLSARLSRVFDLGDRKIVPQLRVDWRHEMLDRRQEFSAAFTADPTVFFDVEGATYARDVFSTGASVTMPITGQITGYADAQGAFSEDSTSVMVSIGGRATW